MRTVLLALAFCLGLTPLARAADGIVVEDAWARATPGTQPMSAAYFIIRNVGTSDDVLTGAETDVAEKTELHESKLTGTMMQMKALGEAAIPAGQSVTFKPGGKHVMLMGLKQPLKKGERFELTLKFRNAGRQVVKVEILGVRETGPPI